MIPKKYSSGTDAGYAFALKNLITQQGVEEYSGRSSSFKAGMQKYVDEQNKRVIQSGLQPENLNGQSTSAANSEYLKSEAWNQFNSGEISLTQATQQAYLPKI